MPETSRELKRKFAKDCLTGDVKKEYLDSLKPVEKTSMDMANFDIEVAISRMNNEGAAERHKVAEEEKNRIQGAHYKDAELGTERVLQMVVRSC